jgi:hypothetical protein
MPADRKPSGRRPGPAGPNEAKAAGRYFRTKLRQAERNRAATKAAQDVAPIPDVRDPARRSAAAGDLRLFCQSYFPEVFYLPWAAEQLRAIQTLQRVVLEGGLFAYALPRGSGKTCLARAAALWAVLYGRRSFVVLIAGSRELGEQLLAPIQMAMLEGRALYEDFPEAIHCLRRLENSSKRQKQQHIAGELTHVHWSDSRIVFPRVPESHLPAALRAAGLTASPSAGAIISATSMEAHLKGQAHGRPDGTIIRPSLLLLDDLQTRASAASTTQTRRAIRLLNGDILGLAGPGQRIAAMLTCTRCYDGDLASQVTDRQRSPEWHGQVGKLVVAFPADAALWARYAELRADRLRRGLATPLETDFYRRNRRAMDAGAEVPWPGRYDRGQELSPLQHAMNLKLRDEEAFAAEYQNEPIREQVADDVLTPQQVAAKVSGRPRGEVPAACSRLTGFVDVQDRLLYWCACAWKDDFTGYVVDYGTFPEQGRGWFLLRSARRTIRQAYPGLGDNGALQAALEALVAALLAREWPRAGGGLSRIEPLLVDMGYKPEIVAAVKHRLGGATMHLARGVGIGARNRPMSQYRRRPGERHGHHWYMPAVAGTREFPHVAADVNWWKTWVHQALATPAGEPGSLSLFGRKPVEHELFAEHVAGSETWVATHGQGRDVHEWRQRPGHPDNHWFDCLVGCAVGASLAGASPGGAQGGPRRRVYTQADLRRR